jgi:hypothetical protein
MTVLSNNFNYKLPYQRVALYALGVLFGALLVLIGSYLPAFAQTTHASGEKLATAVGHYARARSHIIAAIREFDTGRKFADPEPLLDSSQWRNNLISRAEELEKVLDPQPRSSKSGARFDPDPRLMGEAK